MTTEEKERWFDLLRKRLDGLSDEDQAEYDRLTKILSDGQPRVPEQRCAGDVWMFGYPSEAAPDDFHAAAAASLSLNRELLRRLS